MISSILWSRTLAITSMSSLKHITVKCLPAGTAITTRRAAVGASWPAGATIYNQFPVPQPGHQRRNKRLYDGPGEQSPGDHREGIMEFIIKHFAPFWWMKRQIIKAALAGMSDTAKEKMLKEVIASQLPKFCLGHRPYQKNGKKRAETEMEHSSLEHIIQQGI